MLLREKSLTCMWLICPLKLPPVMSLVLSCHEYPIGDKVGNQLTVSLMVPMIAMDWEYPTTDKMGSEDVEGLSVVKGKKERERLLL